MVAVISVPKITEKQTVLVQLLIEDMVTFFETQCILHIFMKLFQTNHIDTANHWVKIKTAGPKNC